MLGGNEAATEREPGRMPRGRTDLVLRELGQEGLLYDREGGFVHILNLTALITWRLCDGTRTLDQIVESLRSSYTNVDPSALRKDIEGVVAIFAERGLLDRR